MASRLPKPFACNHNRDRLICLSEVMSMAGLKKTAIYNLIKEGDFPRQVLIGSRSSRWRESEICHWIDAKSSASPLRSR
ncbi:helix-turn-helix transcriptional regulator [Sphingomonas sp. Tas61C01]|uniref:helix-turn-helix transcriptional regulator n=1 Tax=Sphingomonas sp. Tas61C01 TaxID=3458297 RepID=UPI00403E811D